MKDLIKLIEEASVNIPYEWASKDMSTGIPYAYQSGLLDGRKQALNIIRKYEQDNCEHVYGSNDGACLNCNFQA